MKSKSLILMIVSLGFGLIAAIGISQVMGKGNANAKPEIQMGPVVVALEELAHGDELTEENCKIENWPADIIPEEACRNMEELKGMAISHRLSKSLPVMRNDILKASDIGVVKIPAGYKVVAIKVGADDTLSGLLQPGHKVDVIGVVKVKGDNNNSNQTKTISETFLRNVEVFSVNDKTRIRGKGEGGADGSAVVGVLLKEQQAEQLVWIQKVARLKLVIRGEEEDGDEEAHLDQEKFDSIFGIANTDLQDNGTQTVAAQDDSENHTMKIYSGGGVTTMQFQGKDHVSTSVQAPAGDSAGSGNSSESNDIDSGLEEDQYPGE